MKLPDWADEYGVDKYGEYAVVNLYGIMVKFRKIEPGTVHRDEEDTDLTVEQAFWIAETTVTQELWEMIMGNNPSSDKISDQNPVESVSRLDVNEFLEKANNGLEGIQLDLPEADQWEYACRAGTTTKYYTGDEITKDQANFYSSSKENKVAPVKSYPPNPWGLYEMHGNVWEWMKK